MLMSISTKLCMCDVYSAFLFHFCLHVKPLNYLHSVRYVPFNEHWEMSSYGPVFEQIATMNTQYEFPR